MTTASRSRLRKLLLVGAIVVAVAAIATLAPVYIATDVANQTSACQREYKLVQAGLDAYMTYFTVSNVTAAGPTNDMSKPVVLYNSSGTPTFLPEPRTLYAYTWDASGRVDIISQAPGGSPIPAGCVVSGP